MTSALKNSFIIISLLIMNAHALAQEAKQDKPDITWGKVSPEDFNISRYGVDTSLGAVIIADVGSSSFKGNTKDWFSLVYKRQTRIKITNKKGLDLSNIIISLYHTQNLRDIESLDDFKASTYNLVNGQVIETKLAKSAGLTETQDKNRTLKKFALENVKEGSILEYSYTIVSDFTFNLQPWTFQREYPELWSEYSVDIPNFFEYVFMGNGYNPFYFQKTTTHPFSYRVVRFANNITSNNETESYQIGSVNTLNRWVMKDVPAIREEKFISSMKNYYSRIEFQLSAYNFRGQPYEPKIKDWIQTSTYLMDEDDNFGLDLKRETAFLNDGLKSIKNSSDNDLDLAKGVFAFVRDHINWNQEYGMFLSQPIRQTFIKKSGNIADVNMLLVAMLIQGKLDAHPFILSTRSHGHTHSLYPLLDEYNYVLAQVNIQGKSYLLDASQTYLGFGQLPPHVYNDQGRVISNNPISISLSPDSIRQTEYSSVILNYDEKNPLQWTGQYNQQYSFFHSDYQRGRLSKKGLNTYLKDQKEEYQNSRSGILGIDSILTSNAQDLNNPLKETFYFKINAGQDAGLIYFVPSWNLDNPGNPFKAKDRKYPVELNNLVDNIYTFQMDVPNGYKVDELPKSARINLNEKEGSFEYSISVEDNIISLKTRLKLNKATFLPEDYAYLRDFYDYIYKKTAEPIVFKKL